METKLTNEQAKATIEKKLNNYRRAIKFYAPRQAIPQETIEGEQSMACALKALSIVEGLPSVKAKEINYFIGSYLIPVYEQEYVDSTLRKDFQEVVDEAEKNYKEMECNPYQKKEKP